MHALRDKGRSIFKLSPHKYPIVGKPGTVAMFTSPGAFEGYSKVVSASKTFQNEICARVLFMAQGFNPIIYVESVNCPVLLAICEKDELVSEKSYQKTAEILRKYAVVKKYPIEHFDVYIGEDFETAVEDQTDFLKKHLLDN
jgi:fermentation-respiration switch protein FrsA (DUF1100 family)